MASGYAGLSLRWARELLALPAFYDSASAAGSAVVDLNPDRDPAVPALAYYHSHGGNPRGNIAIVIRPKLGSAPATVVGLDPAGDEDVYDLTSDRLGLYRGWSRMLGRFEIPDRVFARAAQKATDAYTAKYREARHG